MPETTRPCANCETDTADRDLTVSETGAWVCAECATYEYVETDLPEWAS